jgi:hypothetical protein
MSEAPSTFSAMHVPSHVDLLEHLSYLEDNLVDQKIALDRWKVRVKVRVRASMGEMSFMSVHAKMFDKG